MTYIKYFILALVTLLTVAVISVAAQAGITLRKTIKPVICLDQAYNVKPCRNELPRQSAHDYFNDVDTNIFQPSITYLSPFVKKDRCNTRRNKHPTLLRALFPNLPDLYFDLNRFALDIELSSEYNQVELSSIHLDYRNCW